MAGSRQTGPRQPVPAPEFDVPSPSPAPKSDDFAYAMSSDLKAGQSQIKEALKNLKEKIDSQSSKFEKVEDLRVAVGKLEISVSHLNGELGSAREKLDKVRGWMFWTAGAIAVIGILTPLVIARAWPVPSSPAPTPITQSAPTNSPPPGKGGR
ncbi:DUF1515 domain-containing protein [Methylobacterium sp. WL18]|nr:DUF1515 domain-containing protein [Methylobacterium sp. WL18]